MVLVRPVDGRVETRRPHQAGLGSSFGNRIRLKAALANTKSQSTLGKPAQLDLAHPGDRLQPPERRFDPRPRMLTLRVAVMTRGARDRSRCRPVA